MPNRIAKWNADAADFHGNTAHPVNPIVPPEDAVHVMGAFIGRALRRLHSVTRTMSKVVDIFSLVALIAHDPIHCHGGRKLPKLGDLERDVAIPRDGPDGVLAGELQV